MAKTAVFEAMMGSNLYCMSIIMCFLAHLAIGQVIWCVVLKEKLRMILYGITLKGDNNVVNITWEHNVKVINC
jgi:hypothetical protein